MPRTKTKRQVSEMIDDEQEAQEELVYQHHEKRGIGKLIVTVLLIVIIVAGGWYLLDKYTGLDLPGFSSKDIKSDWSAVFLSNGQVYFGKIRSQGGANLILTDIYYLQVVQVPLQRTQEGGGSNPQMQQELKLIKLGNELHGPTDKMVINNDHILLIESLKEDSRVVQAIDDYLANQ